MYNQNNTLRLGLFILILSLAAVMFPCAAVSADTNPGMQSVQGSDSIKVFINNNQVSFPDAEPFIDDAGRIKVPARYISQGLGASVSWDEEASTAIITGCKNIVLIPGLHTATVDNSKVQLDSSAEIINNRLYVPLRFIAEALGARVQWNGQNRTVKIDTDLPIIKNEPLASIYGVPLHPSFSWTEEPLNELDENLRTLIDADNLQDGARVIVSSWLQKPSSEEIAKWYQESLKTAGWQAKGPAGGGSLWGMSAENNQYSIKITYMWGAGDNEAGIPSDPEKGYRMVIVINNKDRTEQPDNSNIFTVLDESTLSAEQEAFVNSVKEIKGIHHLDNLYVIALGAMPNPGYGLEIVKTEMSWEQAKVCVKLTTPDPDMMYAAVISYPYLAGRAVLPPYTTISFINVETGDYL